MYPIKATQVKAARALLGWSQDDLAKKADVSRTTIRSLEDNYAIRMGTMNEIQRTLERAGIEFLENDGVSRHTDGAKVYKGPKSTDIFFDDVVQTVEEQGGDIFAVIKSQGIMTRLSVISDPGNLGRLKSVRESTQIKCLFADTPSPSFIIPSLQFRIPFEDSSGPSCYFVYGDKRADITLDGDKNPIFVVYDGAAAMADDYRKYFLSLWENASPYIVQTSPRKHRSANT